MDAAYAPLGRIAIHAAKQTLLGRSVIIVNCSEALISGRREDILAKYQKARARGGSSMKGPHFPKNPERIMKRTIRGMLRYKRGRGGTAFKNVICFNETPSEYAETKKISFPKKFKVKTINLKELSQLI